jgi:hypothetical protein
MSLKTEGPICSADGCSRREPCGFTCRDEGNFDHLEASASDIKVYDAIADNYKNQLVIPNWPMAQRFISPQDVITTLEFAKTNRSQCVDHVAACLIAAHWLSQIAKEKLNAST